MLIVYVAVDAFQNFLKGFKTTQSDPSAALEDLHIDDEDEELMGGTRDRSPKVKYMDLLQKIANRDADSITIELDDIDSVRGLIRMRTLGNSYLTWRRHENNSTRSPTMMG